VGFVGSAEAARRRFRQATTGVAAGPSVDTLSHPDGVDSLVADMEALRQAVDETHSTP
jgi:hypothetical protein